MSKPTDEDRIEATRRLLAGLVGGVDANQLVVEMADLHVRQNTFPGEVFMDLAADALRTAGVDRAPGIAHRDLLSKHLGEVEFRGKEHRRIQYAILTAFAVQGGLEPDLLDEVTYWIEQYWQYALLAAVAIIRECAEHSVRNDRAVLRRRPPDRRSHPISAQSSPSRMTAVDPLGDDKTADHVLVDFAEQYADLNERDHAAHEEAIEASRVAAIDRI